MNPVPCPRRGGGGGTRSSSPMTGAAGPRTAVVAAMLRPRRKGTAMTKRLWTMALVLAVLVGLAGGLGAADRKDEAPPAPAGAGPNEAQQIAMAYDLAAM